MTAPVKVILVLLLWLLYSIVAYQGCLKDCCLGGADANAGIVPAETQQQATATRYPIDFKWGDATAYTNEGYDDLKATILAGKTGDNILEITGLYYDGEPAPAGFENMGFARADAIKQKMVAAGIPADRIKTRARLIDGTLADKNQYFEAADMQWISPEQKTEATVETIAQGAIIRFPFNSTAKDYDPAVETYLDKLAAQLKTSGGSVSITGHTDNVGDDASNQALGQRRADAIKAVLVKRGATASQISTNSKGESQPVDTNDTDEGRHNNRRAEIKINQ